MTTDEDDAFSVDESIRRISEADSDEETKSEHAN